MIRYQADADLNGNIILAAEAGRILVSHDMRTMPEHFAAHIMERTSPGVIILPQTLSIRESAEYLVLIWAVTKAEE